MFWSHTIWYILLGVITVSELAILLWYSPHRRKFLIALYLTITGLAFSFEMMVLTFFKAYSYMPMLIPQSPPDDSIAGNLFSQFSVSATAVLIARFRLRYYWYFIFSVAYGLIEELFLYLDIYKHNWYQTWMTVALLPILFWIAQRAHDSCLKPIWRQLRFVYIFLGLVTLHIHSISWPLNLAGIREYGQLLHDRNRSIIVLSLLYTLILGSAIMYIHFSRINWMRKLSIILVLYVGVRIAEHYQIILIKNHWFLFTSSIAIWGMYLYTYVLDQLYNQSLPSNESHAGQR